MKMILAIDTSCDETSVAVTEGRKILANVLWSQASLHSKFGGVFPSLAKREHEERIDWVIEKSLKTARLSIKDIDIFAVTTGPGLAIALEVGIKKAKELSIKYQKPLIPVNHIEGHLLSPLAIPKKSNREFKKSEIFPALGLIASGKHTDLVLVNDIQKYKVIANTIDDALGEALDKAARMLGLGYPGGAILEKMAKLGDPLKYELPVPMLGREKELEFSYSGLKTAMWRLTEKEKPLNKTKIQDLAACFQDKAFKHVERMVIEVLRGYEFKTFFFGGGVSANVELRKRLRKLLKDKKIPLLLPYSNKLCTDNAAMIGVAAYFNPEKKLETGQVDLVDREPRLNL